MMPPDIAWDRKKNKMEGECSCFVEVFESVSTAKWQIVDEHLVPLRYFLGLGGGSFDMPKDERV